METNRHQIKTHILLRTSTDIFNYSLLARNKSLALSISERKSEKRRKNKISSVAIDKIYCYAFVSPIAARRTCTLFFAEVLTDGGIEGKWSLCFGNAENERIMITTADTEQGVTTGMIEVNTAPDAVFRSLTDPTELGTWWGCDTFRTHWIIDLRPGGSWSAYSTGENPEEVCGEFLTADVPRHLEFTWNPSWEDFTTKVRYQLEGIPSGTRLIVTHTGFVDQVKACEKAREAWNRILGWLKSFHEPAGG
jgi:uncharacterized protein YndB with AHSA1/START domain